MMNLLPVNYGKLIWIILLCFLLPSVSYAEEVCPAPGNEVNTNHYWEYIGAEYKIIGYARNYDERTQIIRDFCNAQGWKFCNNWYNTESPHYPQWNGTYKKIYSDNSYSWVLILWPKPGYNNSIIDSDCDTFSDAVDQCVADSVGKSVDEFGCSPDQNTDDDIDLGSLLAGKHPICPFEGNPVNITNGNNYESSEDIRFQSPFRGGFIFERFYNSRSSASGAMGFGWTHSYNAQLLSNYDSNPAFIKIIDGTGGGFYFLAEGGGAMYVGRFMEESSVDKIGEAYAWRRLDGQTYWFDLEGRLIKIEDQIGNIRELDYSTENRLETITDIASGRIMQFHYREDGFLSHISGPVTAAVPDGIWVRFDYQDQNLISVVYPDGSGFDYVYGDPGDAHNLTQKENKLGQVLSIWTYDDQDRVIDNTTRDGRGVSINYIGDSEIETTDAYGVIKKYTIGSISSRRKITAVEGLSGCTACGETVVRVAYDDKLRVVEKEYSNGRIDRFADFDSQGNAQTVVLASGSADEQTLYFTFDQNLQSNLERKLSQTAVSVLDDGSLSKHKETSWDYDNDGNDSPNENPTPLLRRIIEKGFTKDISGGVAPFEYITEYQYNSTGQLVGIDGPLPGAEDTVTYTYDTATGDLLSVDHPGAGAITYEAYDAAGRPGRIVDENGQGVVLTYDGRGRLLTRTREADGYEITNTYDLAGEVATVSDSEGFSLTYDYDTTYGRLARITDNLGNYITYAYDANGNRIETANFTAAGDRTLWQRFSYDHPDQPGKLWKVINPDDTFTSFGYDAMGQVNTVTDPLGKVTNYTHDLLHRITRESRPGSVGTDYAYDPHGNAISVTDAEGLVTNFVYDDLGRKVSETSPDRGTMTYAYDVAGNLARHSDARGTITSYSYDNQGRLIEVAFPDTTQSIAYTYDQGANGIGRLTGMHDPAGTIVYLYDSRGFLVSAYFTMNDVVYTTSYRYAANGTLAGITYPDGREVEYSLDSQGRVTSVATTVNGVTRTLAQDIGYQPFGPGESMTLGNGQIVTRAFDQQQRMTGIEAAGVLELGFTRDAAGNVTAIDNYLDDARNQAFVYDDLYRLASATGINGTVSFTYDKVGNRLTRTAGSQTDTYAYEPNSNRLASIDGAASMAFGYDAAGNMISRGERSLTYNESNRLIRVTQGGRPQGAYVYNGIGQRVLKTADDDTTVYHWDQFGNLIAESDAAGNFKVSYVYLGSERLAAIAAVAATGEFGVKVTTDEGRSLAGIKVYAFEGGAYRGVSATTDDAGRAVFVRSELGEGTYTFRADYLGDQFWSDAVTMPQAVGTVVEIKEAEVAVKVTQGGAGRSGVKVYLFNDGGTYLGRYAVTDANGEAVFTLPADQQYKLRADLMGNQYFSDVVTIDNDAPNTLTVDTGGGTLQVTIDRGDGTPMAGVKTYLFSMAGAYLGLSETSAAEGSVSFDLPAGNYKVRADYLGYSYWTESLGVSVYTDTALTIPHQTVTVTLTGDYDGFIRPLTGSDIFLFTAAGSYQNISAATDSQGQAAFELPPGAYKVRADHLGQRYWSKVFDQADTDVVVEEAMAHVAVTLFDQPIEDVPVYLFNIQNDYLNINGTTTANGPATFRLPAGEYNCRADYFGNQYNSGSTTLIAHQENPVTISTGGGNFALTVEKNLGQPLEGATCFLFSDNGAYLGHQTATDAYGDAGFELADGAYNVRVDYMGYQYWTPVFEIPAKSAMIHLIDHVDTTLSVAHGMLGSDIPGEDLKTYLFTASGTYQNLMETTDPNGEAVFSLPVGDYKFRVDYLGQQFWSDITNQTDIEVYIPEGLARVQVSQAGQSVEGVPVYLFTETGSYLNWKELTNTDGEALFQVPVGDYRFRADHLGSQYWAGGAVDADTETLVSTPTGGGNLVFTVQKGGGAPLAGVPVYLFTPGGNYLGENQVTDAAGAVDFDLTDGSYKFRADYLGYQYWSDIYTVLGSVSESLPIVHQDVTVNAGATYGTERLAIENAKSYVFTAAGAYQGINAVTDTAGNVVFTLPDQAYKVRVDYLRQQYWSAEFTGADTQVDIPHSYVYVRVSDAGAAVQGARVYLFTEAGAYLSRYVETDAVGEAAFFIPEGVYKFRVDYDGQQYWSDTLNTIGHEDMDLPMALDLLVRNKTNNPHPQRYDGQPPDHEPKPVYLASLTSMQGILVQSVVGATPQGAVYYFLNDHLGTPLIAVDENGAVVWEADYEPFGEVGVGTQTYSYNFRFAGQYYDEETSLHYNYHRYYDPQTGRYLTPDPIGLAGGFNLYAYTDNNPINGIDALGLLTEAYHAATGGGWKAPPMPYNPSHNMLRRIDDNTIDNTIRAAGIAAYLSDRVMKNKMGTAVFTGIGVGAGAIKISNNNNLSLNYITKESIYMYKKMVPEAALYGDYIIQKIVSAEWDGNTLVWLVEETLQSFSDAFWKYINRSEGIQTEREVYWEQNKCK